jgi:hypothetical protein
LAPSFSDRYVLLARNGVDRRLIAHFRRLPMWPTDSLDRLRQPVTAGLLMPGEAAERCR